MQPKAPAKKFSGSRDFSAKQYDARNFNQADGAVADDLAAKKSSAGNYSEATKAAGSKSAVDANKEQTSKSYTGNRPYLEKGKSQKSMTRKNKPMTIDEVRELLNKSK
jgi:hypothetical protein